jgi:oxygen-independent coproporphyrinogen-3 oxidase
VIGLYLHVPYCTVRCSYCDFYLVPARGRDLAAYAAALGNEIAAVAPPLCALPADTVHLGGGTPSLLPTGALARLLGTVRGVFRLDPGAEIALEANPEDLDRGRIEGLLAAGVNRLSVGVQSLDDRLLRRLRRGHDGARAIAALRAARAAGVRSLAADLMLGLPGQDEGEACDGIARIADLGVDHLSLYLLELHPRTRLGRQVALGRLAPPPEEAAAGLYERAAGLVVSLGFEHYEISNFARPGHRSRHNLKYWTDEEYLGFGPSAHSYASGRRWMNAPRLDDYLAARGIGIARVEDPQPRLTRGTEALLAGLRLADGVDLAGLRRRYGEGLPAPDGAAVAGLVAGGLLEVREGRVRLTRRGRLVSNEVGERLLPAAAPVD